MVILFFENLILEVLRLNDEVKNYIDSKFNEVNEKLDNLLSLFEKIRSNEVRTLLYSQLCSRQLNSFFYVDWLRNQSIVNCKPFYEKINDNSSYKKAHPITKMCAEDLTDLVIKKSKGRKDLLEDEFTKSLSFISGIDESLL